MYPTMVNVVYQVAVWSVDPVLHQVIPGQTNSAMPVEHQKEDELLLVPFALAFCYQVVAVN